MLVLELCTDQGDEVVQVHLLPDPVIFIVSRALRDEDVVVPEAPSAAVVGPCGEARNCQGEEETGGCDKHGDSWVVERSLVSRERRELREPWNQLLGE